MKKLYERLQQIRMCPGMYIGKKSLICLKPYLHGMVDCVSVKGEKDSCFLEKFSAFVNEKVQLDQPLDWYGKIISFYPDEEEAVDVFFQLADDFFEMYYKGIYDEFKIRTVVTKEIPVKERHYTTHGNAVCFSNPHDHNIAYLAGGKIAFSGPINYADEQECNTT